jgi:Subunit 11 of the general transcription factor TFIIH
LRKLDHCYASLLCGQDINTKESLPGFESGLRAGMTTTDMVRCRSIVEETRIVVVNVMNKVEREEEDEPGTATDTETDGLSRIPAWDDDSDGFHMDVARVYEHTLVHLGGRLGTSLGPTTT